MAGSAPKTTQAPSRNTNTRYFISCASLAHSEHAQEQREIIRTGKSLSAPFNPAAAFEERFGGDVPSLALAKHLATRFNPEVLKIPKMGQDANRTRYLF